MSYKTKKHLLSLAIFALISSFVFAEQIILERRVDNKVKRYFDKQTFEEHGVVTLYINEYTNTDGTKYGMAYAIESQILNSIGKPYTGWNNEDEAPLMYYIKDDRFYIGSRTSFLKSHLFYDFDKKDGYGLYFMIAYAGALNMTLTYGNSITLHEVYDIDGKNIFYSADSEYDIDFYFKTGNSKLAVRLLKDAKTRSSAEAGRKITENLKKYGLWKAIDCMYLGDGTMQGAYGPNEGVITCWYEPFKRYGNMQSGLEEMEQKNLLINYKEVSIRKMK